MRHNYDRDGYRAREEGGSGLADQAQLYTLRTTPHWRLARRCASWATDRRCMGWETKGCCWRRRQLGNCAGTGGCGGLEG